MKRNHVSGFKTHTCDKCGAKAHSMINTFHRRCTSTMSEAEVVPIRPKHDLLPKNQRGQWR